jgi:hypothetical protein
MTARLHKMVWSACTLWHVIAAAAAGVLLLHHVLFNSRTTVEECGRKHVFVAYGDGAQPGVLRHITLLVQAYLTACVAALDAESPFGALGAC